MSKNTRSDATKNMTDSELEAADKKQKTSDRLASKAMYADGAAGGSYPVLQTPETAIKPEKPDKSPPRVVKNRNPPLNPQATTARCTGCNRMLLHTRPHQIPNSMTLIDR
jgi:hypothetical protein